MNSVVNPISRLALLQSPVGGFDTSFVEWRDRVLSRGFSSPSAAYQIMINRFIESLKRGGAGWTQVDPADGIDLWDDTYGIWIAANDSANAWKVNVKSPALYEATEQGGALSKTNDGVAGNGTTTAANTNLTPLGVMIANNLSAWGFFKSIGGTLFGTENTAANRYRLLTTDFAVNGTRGTHSAFTDEGYYIINADSSVEYRWQGLSCHKQASAGLTIGTLPTVPMYFSGRNNNGTLVSGTTRTSIFGMSKAFLGNEIPLGSCIDEYINGEWPLTKLYSQDVTPPVDGTNDYQVFPDFLIGRIGANLGKYYEAYTKAPDHNVNPTVYNMFRTSTDKGITWNTPQQIISSLFGRTVLLSSTNGAGTITVDGVGYTVTYVTSLTVTASNFVTAHSAALALRGYTVTSSGATISIVRNNEQDSVVTFTNTSGTLAGAISVVYKAGEASLGESSGGRLFFYYLLVPLANTQLRVPYVKYSDDGGETWSLGIKVTTDFEPNGQLAGPGGSITLANGDIIKTYYGRTGSTGNRKVYVYKSTAASNGLVWTQISNVDYFQTTLTGTSGTANVNVNGVNYLATFSSNLTTTAANFVTTHGATLSGLGITVTASTGILTFATASAYTAVSVSNVTGDLSGTPTADFEEPTIRLLPNGNLLMLIRSDAYISTYYTVSTDSGVTWSKPLFQTESWGKNPIAVNPDGLIICLGRWSGNTNTNYSRGMISYANQSDLTRWRTRYIDDVNKFYMYAGADWDNEQNYFVSIYGRETANDFQSPTKQLMNKWSIV